MPGFIRTALTERRLTAAYSERPAYQQNDYIGWITRAKRPETERKRLDQMLDELERGGVYMKMKHAPSRRRKVQGPSSPSASIGDPEVLKKARKRKDLDQVLQSVSDIMFPAELGKRKVGLGSRDVDGDTPLHVLVWRGDVYGSKVLITAGADVDAIGDMGETPLHVALTKENAQLVEILLRAGADPDIRSEFNETAREKATRLGGTFIKLLRRYCDRSPHCASIFQKLG